MNGKTDTDDKIWWLIDWKKKKKLPKNNCRKKSRKRKGGKKIFKDSLRSMTWYFFWQLSYYFEQNKGKRCKTSANKHPNHLKKSCHKISVSNVSNINWMNGK